MPTAITVGRNSPEFRPTNPKQQHPLGGNALLAASLSFFCFMAKSPIFSPKIVSRNPPQMTYFSAQERQRTAPMLLGYVSYFARNPNYGAKETCHQRTVCPHKNTKKPNPFFSFSTLVCAAANVGRRAQFPAPTRTDRITLGRSAPNKAVRPKSQQEKCRGWAIGNCRQPRVVRSVCFCAAWGSLYSYCQQAMRPPPHVVTKCRTREASWHFVTTD